MSDEYAISADIDLANLALLFLGADPVAALDDSNKRSSALRRLLPISKREILDIFPWSSCLKRVKLAPEASAPTFGWSCSFRLPPDCVKPWFVNGLRIPNAYMAYEGRKILANENLVNVIYVAEIPYASMPQSLLSAIAARLAMNAMITIGIGEKKMPSVIHLADSRLEEACDADKIGGELERAAGLDEYALARLGFYEPTQQPSTWEES